MLKGILRGLKVEGEDLIVVGVVVSWSGKDVYYVFFKEYIYLLLSQLDDSQVELVVDNNLIFVCCVNVLKSVVQFLVE